MKGSETIGTMTRLVIVRLRTPRRHGFNCMTTRDSESNCRCSVLGFHFWIPSDISIPQPMRTIGVANMSAGQSRVLVLHARRALAIQMPSLPWALRYNSKDLVRLDLKVPILPLP